MAATRLIPCMNKGKPLPSRVWGDQNGLCKESGKTERSELVTCYQCDPMTVDEEFMLSKRQYEQITGRRQSMR